MIMEISFYMKMWSGGILIFRLLIGPAKQYLALYVMYSVALSRVAHDARHEF